jgi:hypothetical protein
MSMEIPADAIVGAATVPAAIIKPNSSALREAFIHNSFLMFRPTRDDVTKDMNVLRTSSVDRGFESVGQHRIGITALHL